MGIFSPGFRGRRREGVPGLPPGQHLVTDFPVLSVGPTPRINLAEWQLSLGTESGVVRRWNWDEFLALPQEDVNVDIHCVTSWSKFGTGWRGVSLDTLLEGVETEAQFAFVRCYGGYTTNVPLDELRGGKAWIAHRFDGAELAPEHGGPARLLVPALYFWKSAKWVTSLELRTRNDPGFWEENGYHMHGDPWQEERYW
ncbi:MAG: molybdopterin-dependent oxidoreductase [Candidatus Saccharibacteria bacterium]|nr:molybdopterin-dependent oxidoreductase [Microbacteriaceae bacterium]